MTANPLLPGFATSGWHVDVAVLDVMRGASVID
jgi:hypothetical protein